MQPKNNGSKKKTENFAADNINWGISNQSFQHKWQETRTETDHGGRNVKGWHLVWLGTVLVIMVSTTWKKHKMKKWC